MQCALHICSISSSCSISISNYITISIVRSIIGLLISLNGLMILFWTFTITTNISIITKQNRKKFKLIFALILTDKCNIIIILIIHIYVYIFLILFSIRIHTRLDLISFDQHIFFSEVNDSIWQRLACVCDESLTINIYFFLNKLKTKRCTIRILK